MGLIQPRRGNRENFMGTLKRLLLNPFAFGLIFGGVPLAVLLGRLGRHIVSPDMPGSVTALTPLAVAVTTVGSLLARRAGWKRLIRAAFSCSTAACVPLPLAACLSLLWHFGYPLSSPQNSVFLFFFFLLWGVVVKFCGWVLALAVQGSRRVLQKNSS